MREVIPHLLNYVWKTVRKERERWLDLPAFRRVFEEAIIEQIPKTELANLRRAALELAPFERPVGGGVNQGIVIETPVFPQSVLAMLKSVPNDRFLPREQLIADYKVRLNTSGLLVLKGSTGMGKPGQGCKEKTNWASHMLSLISES